MLVLGGGIIGLEMATVYHALGAKVTVIEMMDQLMPGADRDIVAPLAKRVEKLYDKILLKTKVTRSRPRPTGCTSPSKARTARRRTCSTRCWSRSGAGRTAGRSAPRRPASPSTSAASSPSTGRCAPTSQHIFAIGDVVGQPMLAHKASHEGKVAAEVGERPQIVVRRQGDPVGRLHRSGSRLGRRRPRPRPRRRGSNTARRCSRGRRAAGRCRSAATRA